MLPLRMARISQSCIKKILFCECLNTIKEIPCYRLFLDSENVRIEAADEVLGRS